MNDYAKYWDKQYLQDYYISKRGSLWDVKIEDSILQDFYLFDGHLDESLPLLDIGCGIGRISDFLSKHYDKVLGIDISKRAISIAKREFQRSGLDFKVMNIMDKKDHRLIRSSLGNCNIYIRGVLHQLNGADRSYFIKQLSLLLGKKGKLVVHEVKEGLQSFLGKGVEQTVDLPTQMKEVFNTQFPPRGMSRELFDGLFENPWNQEYFEERQLASNLKLSSGETLYVPSVFAIYSFG